MKLYTAAQMRAADALAAAHGVPAAQLMDAAGTGVARALRQWYPDAEHVFVLCGAGNNGGDGYVAATTLAAQGVPVSVFELGGAAEAADRAKAALVGTRFDPAPHPPAGSWSGSSAPALPDAVAARDTCAAAGLALRTLTAGTAASVLEQVSAARGAVVIDALFGSGLNRPLEGWLAQFVQDLNDTGATIVAVDIPSGLSADLATPIGPHVRAHLTVELAGHKPAALFYPARHAFGRRVLVDIGIPQEVLDAASTVEILSAAGLAPNFPRLDPAGHKYSAGTVCVVAGSAAYLGAAELACRGAWRGGAGLVTLVASQRFAGAWPETIFEQHDWSTAQDAWPPPDLAKRRAGAMVVRPGLDRAALPYLPQVLEWAPGAVVLDAAALDPDAVWAVTDQLRRTPAVITPHAGEAEALLQRLAYRQAGTGDSARYQPGLVTRDPLRAAALLAQMTNAVAVLKGPTTVVAEPAGGAAISLRGAPAMATGGTGDVLAGLIGALLAKPGGEAQVFERTCMAVWLHGVAGELAAAKLGQSVVASDVVEQLPLAVAQLLRPNA